MEFVEGAMDYSDNSDPRPYCLFDPATALDNWEITHSGATEILAPGSRVGYATVAEAEAGNRPLTKEFYHDGSSTISMTFHDNFGRDNGDSSPPITWRLVLEREIFEGESGKLDLVVGDVDLQNPDQVAGNAAKGDKGGHYIQQDTFVPLYALVPPAP
ncbi:unnamed protein product, partial [Ectocarpus sp. 8 AP-2014]